MKVNFAEGGAVAILLPLIFLLTGTFSWGYMVSAMLLLLGAWSVVFGLFMATTRDRMYYVALGAILIALSTVSVVAIQYTIALVVAVIVLLVILSAAERWLRRAKMT